MISFSLFGGAEKYNAGMLANLSLAWKYFPGWSVGVYCDPLATATDELIRLGAYVTLMPIAPGAKAMAWRFIAAADDSFDYVIFRDADSRLNPRDAAAVNAWIDSGKTFHVMRDHEHHRCYPMFGGMWGCKGGALPDMPKWIKDRREWGARLDDMLLLAEKVWPIARNDLCHHTSVENPYGGEPFPPHEEYAGFVGQIYEQ